MTAATTEVHVSTTAPAPDGTRLDDLLDRTHEELDAMYAQARVPRLSSVRGDLRGRMLAVVVVPRGPRRALRRFAGSSLFPWRGKSFRPLGEDAGEGINRVVSNRLKLFRFETSVGPSRAGAFDAVQLDYDLPENPWFIRRIKDEIREVRPNLYLGQAWFVVPGGGPKLVLWFGLEG